MASQIAGTDNPDADFSEHVSTYRLFTSGIKYGALGVVAILIILALLTL
jgi:hypothetical protein